MPCHFRQISNFLFIPPPVCQFLCRMKCLQIAETVISMTVSSISFLACPFSFMKVRDILPGCLLNCLSSLEPVTHAQNILCRFPYPLLLDASEIRQPPSRKRHIFDGCFMFNQIHSCQFMLLTHWAQSMLHQQTRAFPVWSQVCCIFLSHSSSVHTVDLWFHFINIQICNNLMLFT